MPLPQRTVSEQLATRHPAVLKAGEKLCTCCRKRLANASASNEVDDGHVS